VAPRIRVALPAETERLTAIAHASKRHWGYPEAWIEMWRDALTITPGYLAAHDVFVVERARDPLGFYALVERDKAWDLDHFWIHPNSMGHGLGRALFNHAVGQVRRRERGASLEIESDPNAESFYLHMGARRVGEISTEWPGMTRTLPLLAIVCD